MTLANITPLDGFIHEKPRILLIDDDAMTQLLVREVLGKDGFEIVTADNGECGLTAYAEHQPHLILLDVLMPVVDGFEFLQRLGEQHRPLPVPVVMMTAIEDIHCVERAYQLGASDFISKPIQWLLLPYRIRYVLRNHRAHCLLREQQRQLRQSEERLRLSLKAAKQGLYDLNIQTGETIVNEEYARMLGYDPAGFRETNTDWMTRLHPEDQLHVAETYRRYVAGELDEYRAEYRQRCADGSWKWILSIGSIVEHDEQGRPLRMLGTHTDINDRKAAEAKIEYLARHDPLTNLPNRSLLHDRFEQAIAHAMRNETLVALMFLDLDHFKQINDTMGHDAGDRLLQGIAERLVQCVREVDTVCRQGGDEFIIILTDLTEIASSSHIAQKILDRLHQPFQISGLSVATSFSIGISLFPNDGMSFQSLLNKADTAMYAAKQEGRNAFRYFSHDMNVASIERMNIENGLRLALHQQQFQLHFQPLYSLADNRIVGCEALLRWHSADGTIFEPNQFIPIAEDTGLIIPIGDWVLREACLQNKRWQAAGLDLLITVNISAVQFRRGNLLESVKSALEISGLAPQYLELELTESVLMADTVTAITTINSLKNLGVGIAIDDFGTGYSSLSYLRQFAVSKLKIDHSFIKQLGANNQDNAIVKAIIQLGATLGLQTLAEGVETREQAEQLVELGCEKAQGHYWNYPLSAQEFEALFD